VAAPLNLGVIKNLLLSSRPWRTGHQRMAAVNDDVDCHAANDQLTNFAVFGLQPDALYLVLGQALLGPVI
jgi:hypothetical protein